MKLKLYRYIAILFVILLSCSNNHNESLTGAGVLEGTEIVLSSQMTGTLLSLHVEEGASVERSDLIAEIETETLHLQGEQIQGMLQELEFNISNSKTAISQAKTQFENVSKRYERIKALFESKSATQQQMDDIETQYQTSQDNLTKVKNTYNSLLARKKQVEANLKLNQKRIEDGRITSPISGIVIDKFVEPGEFVAMGSPLVILADLSALWIKLYIKEDQLGFVRLGARAEIKINTYPDKSFPGKVVWISPKAEFTTKNVQTKEARADLVYAIKISVPNESGILKIGMPADIVLKKEIAE